MKTLLFLSFYFFETLCFAQYAQSVQIKSAQSSSNLKWGGDLRVRAQSETNLPSPGEDRVSQKLRLRFGVKAEVSSDVRAEIRIATAQAHNSTNQSLGDNREPGMARRFVGIDLAYAQWKVDESIDFLAGRFSQVHDKPGGSQILLDSDIALEGGTIMTNSELGDTLLLRTNWGSAWIRENYDTYYSQEATDNMLNWGQVIVDYKISETTLSVGTGFFNFVSLQGKRFSDISAGATARGNSQSSGGTYSDNYLPRQYFLNATTDYSGFKTGVFAEYIVNSETRSPNRGTWTGLLIGKNQWTVQGAFADVQSDAVPAIFTDSDFAGGATDCSGYMISSQWKTASRVSFGVTQYLSHKLTSDGDTRYNRTHLDVGTQF